MMRKPENLVNRELHDPEPVAISLVIYKEE
jgi:hypothetical protein